MKKFIIAAGALLFAAVFLSGCVAETDDPVLGIWHNEENIVYPNGFVYESGYIIFCEDGTGFYLVGHQEGMVNIRFDFTWKNTGSGKYQLTHTDLKGTDLPEVVTLILKDDKLVSEAQGGNSEFHREAVADYLNGLRVSAKGDYQGYEGVRVMLYFQENGTGNLIFYTSAVTDRSQTASVTFEWTEKDGVVMITGEKGNLFELTVKDGNLLFGDLKNPIHKYTAEDYLIAFWLSDEPVVEDGITYAIVTMLRSDGTGVEFWTIPGTYQSSFKYQFTWKMLDSTTFEALYEDGDVWTFTYDQLALELFDAETHYHKVSFEVLREFLNREAA